MREAMQAEHPGEHAGTGGVWYVVGVDVAGQDTALVVSMLNEPSKGGCDATVVTIGRVSYNENSEPPACSKWSSMLPGAAPPTRNRT